MFLNAFFFQKSRHVDIVFFTAKSIKQVKKKNLSMYFYLLYASYLSEKSAIVFCMERLPVKDIVCQELYIARNVIWGHMCGCFKEKAQGNYCMVRHMLVTGEHTQDFSRVNYKNMKHFHMLTLKITPEWSSYS